MIINTSGCCRIPSVFYPVTRGIRVSKEFNDFFVTLADAQWPYAPEYVLIVLNHEYISRVVFSVSSEPFAQLTFNSYTKIHFRL